MGPFPFPQDPSWKNIVLGFRNLTPKELELFPGYRYFLSRFQRVTGGFSSAGPVGEMSWAWLQLLPLK